MSSFSKRVLGGNLRKVHIVRCIKKQCDIMDIESESNSDSREIIKVMKSNLHDVKVQVECLNRLRLLARNEKEIQDIGRAGGIKIIIKSMVAHIHDPLVQVNSCSTLQKLAFMDSKYLLAAGTAASRHGPTVVSSRNQEGIPEFECCSSLEQLTSFNVYNMSEIISSGGIEAIFSAMKFHPDHLPVQLYGVCVLACFTFSPDYLRLLRGDEPEYLLEAAARRFPSMCSHDALNVLARISELSN